MTMVGRYFSRGAAKALGAARICVPVWLLFPAPPVQTLSFSSRKEQIFCPLLWFSEQYRECWQRHFTKTLGRANTLYSNRFHGYFYYLILVRFQILEVLGLQSRELWLAARPNVGNP